MNFEREKAKAMSTALILGAAMALFPVSMARAQTTVCAKINLNISQEATLEREAFDAALGITNEFPSYGLEDFRVDIVIKDADGNAAENLFYTRVNSKDGITAVDGTGVVQPATTANVHWLIIPSTGAGGSSALGRKYSVRAEISYKLNGVYQTASTYDDYITVKPQPALKLEYALPFEVFGDEPLTESVEAVEPFPLGLRVTNVGYGAAKNFKMDSGTPDIVDNKQGLAVNVNLLGTYLGPQKIADTLLIPFGDIPAGGAAQAAWLMSATLSGRFIKFDASFTHADELGGQLTSLVQSVTTYTLVKDVLVDLPGKDAQFDLLVNTSMPRSSMYDILSAGGEIVPDAILESGQAEPVAVARLACQVAGALGGSNTSLTLKLTGETSSGGWGYASAPAPAEGRARLVSAVRNDGKVINLKNVWISRHFNKETLSYVYRLSLLDHGAPAGAEYSINFARDALDVPPAAITDLSAFRVDAATAALSWNATGEDGSAGSIVGGRYYIQASTYPDAGFGAGANIVLSTNTQPGVPQVYAVGGLSGNSSYYFRLWVEDTGGNRSDASNLAQVYVPPNPPAGLVLNMAGASSAAVSFAGGNNNAPIAYSLWIDTDAADPAVASSPALPPAGLEYLFDGLVPNTTYFFRGQARNPDTLAVSAMADMGGALTLAAAPGPLVSSAVYISSAAFAWEAGGNPAGTEYLAQISTAADWSVPLTAGWSAASSASFEGLAENTLYYVRAKARNSAGAETAFADFGELKTAALDTIAPVSAVIFDGPSYSSGTVYVSSLTGIAFAAADDVSAVGDGLGRVAAVYYAVDGEVYAVYEGSFTIAAEGGHSLRYYAVDAAGNAEAARTAAVTVDNTAPETAFSVQGSSLEINGGLYALAGSSIVIAAVDALSGAGEIRYRLDAATGSAVPPLTLPADPGSHTLAFYAVDNVGNGGQERTAAFYVDAEAPVTTASVAGLAGANGWYVSPVVLALASTDALSGVAATVYALERLAGEERLLISSGAYVSTVGVTGEGSYAYSYNSVDAAGNAEALKAGSFRVDLAAPEVVALSSPSVGAYGWNNTPVEVVFAGTDAVSGIVYCTPAVVLDAEVSSRAVSGYCSDFAGLTSTVSLSVSIDTSAPVSEASLSGITGGGFYASSVTVGIDAADALSGVDKIYYSLDGGAFEVYASTFGVLAAGVHELAYYAADRAGNGEAVRTLSFDIVPDTAPPAIAAIVNGRAIEDGATAYMAAVDSVSILAADPGSGVKSVSYALDAPFSTGTAVAYAAPFALQAGTHTVHYTAEDNVGNAAELKTANLTVVFTPNRSEDGLAVVVTTEAVMLVNAVSTGSLSASSTVYLALSAAGLEPAMAAFYDFEPGGLQFGTPAVLRFAFDPVEVDTAALAIYYFDGVSWSSASVLNQRVVFESTAAARLEGEILHTSLYALLRERAASGPAVTVNLSPSELNLDSKGRYVTAELGFGAGTGCFELGSVNISAVNGRPLRKPIYAERPGRGKGRGYDVQCGTAAAKFDRGEVEAALPVNAVALVTVSGRLSDGAAFSAEDTVRTIKRFKGRHGGKWRFDHGCGAFIEGGKNALREDRELYMLRVDGDLARREKAKERSAAVAGLKRRGAAFEFGPEGLKFDAPVTVGLPYEAGEKAPERLAVAYWNEAASVWEPLASRVDRSGRYIKADVPHFSRYQILESTFAVSVQERTVRARDEDGALPEAAREFRLGEVYVFPNPAKGGKVPVFHVEVGVADTVRIRVYTVAGQLVHEASVGGEPQVVGSAYAYEYAWQGRIASGVYFYTVEARRGGAKLKARGKFAVIR